MAIAGRRRVPAGFTNVTYRTVGPIASIASQPELTVFRPEQPCLPFLPTRTMTGAGMRSAPRYHLAYRTGCAAPNCCTRSREPARPLVFGCLGPIPVGSTGRLPPFFRRLPADNGSLPHNGAYRNTPRGQIAAHGHGTVRSPI